MRSQPVLGTWIEREGSISRHLLRRAVDRVQPQIVFSGHWHQRVTHALGENVHCEVLDMNGKVGNAAILDLPSIDLTELANLDPTWHRWTHRVEKNFKHKQANQRFHELVDLLRADGLSETDARKNASDKLHDEGTE